MEWIAVSEKLPEDHVDVIVWFKDVGADIANYDRDPGWWSLPNRTFEQPDIEPTHWMPLPTPPSEN